MFLDCVTIIDRNVISYVASRFLDRNCYNFDWMTLQRYVTVNRTTKSYNSAVMGFCTNNTKTLPVAESWRTGMKYEDEQQARTLFHIHNNKQICSFYCNKRSYAGLSPEIGIPPRTSKNTMHKDGASDNI